MLIALTLALQIANAQSSPDVDTQVAPILNQRCLPCHNENLKNAGVSFEDHDSLIRTGALVPGNADASVLIRAVRQTGDLKMPPGGRLSRQDVATLTAWVQAGAPWSTKAPPARQPAAKHVAFEIWHFDRLQKIGGYPTAVEGHPRIITSTVGKAIEFNGVNDALFIEDHPLAETATFTWEVVFRPAKGGNPEQRFFHLQERDATTAADTQNRFLFEIRVTGENWYLDSFVMSPAGSKALLNTAHVHPLEAWYHVAAVYDGHEYRNYVNGVLENSGELNFTPQHAGHASAGVRINRRDYFKGAIAQTRFTRGALSPDEFMRVPGIAGK